MFTELTIATRGSQLALWQAEYVADALCRQYPELGVDLAVIKTSGDMIQDVSLSRIGGKGLFVKEIEEALLDGQADLAVHSMKDMPGELPDGFRLGVVPERDDPSDCFLSQRHPDLASIPTGGVLGTSSLRRQAQVAVLRPDLEIRALRGNLDTRLRKLEEGQFDAIVVASVGLKRLRLRASYMKSLRPPNFFPAIGQGALAIEYLVENEALNDFLGFLDHPPSRYAIRTERSFLNRLQGGCQVPVGGYASLSAEGSISFTGFVADLKGERMVQRSSWGAAEEAEQIGRLVADEVLDAGGRSILHELYAG